MNEITDKINGWSQRRWQIGLLIIFTLQIGFFLLFSERNPNTAYEGRVLFAMMTGDSLNLPGELAEIQNPTVFAFPTKNNYSSKSWFSIMPLKNDYYEWTPDNYLLLPMPDVLGNKFSEFLPKLHSLLDVSIFEIRDEHASSILPDLRLENLYTNSVFRIEGEIVNRKLVRIPTLPAIESPDIYPPSIVEIVVNDDGYVISSTLISASGLTTADQKAVELSRNFVFSKVENPGSSSGLTFGKIAFYWFFKPLEKAEKK